MYQEVPCYRYTFVSIPPTGRSRSETVSTHHAWYLYEKFIKLVCFSVVFTTA